MSNMPSNEKPNECTPLVSKSKQSETPDSWLHYRDHAVSKIEVIGKPGQFNPQELSQDFSDPVLQLKDELYNRMSQDPGMFDWIQCALGDGIWYFDIEHNLMWYSPEFKELFGYKDNEVPNTPSWWQGAIFPEDLVTSLEALEEHIVNGSPFDQVVRYHHKDGSTVWVRCHGKAFFNEDGIAIRMLGAHNDLTALMKIQQELRKKEAVLDLLCTTSLDGYWDWNMKTGETFMSKRWKSILGYKDSELTNRFETWLSLLVPEDVVKMKDSLERHKEDAEAFSVVLRYKRKNGTVAHMLAQGVAQRDDCGKWNRFFGTHTDVSYLEEARAAREASAAKTTFLATMSHEIRTPLNAVLGMAQVLLSTELTDEQMDCVNILHNSGTHLLSLINDILDFSQIETGIVRMIDEEVDVQTTVRNVMDVLQHSAQQKDIILAYSSRIPFGSRLRGDPERIRQVVFNLVGNAVKFTSVGDVCVQVAPEERNAILGVMITVKDTGCGIAQNQTSFIFDDFRQANNEIRSQYGGSGLGLSICKKLIHAMGGSIHVESVLGKGSVFSVWLPGLVVSQSQSNPFDADQNVFVYEQVVTDIGSVVDGIQASGFHAKVIQDVKNLPIRSEGVNVIVVHNQGCEISTSMKHFVQDVLENTNSQVIDVGRKFRAQVTEKNKTRYKSLSHFPTSTDFHEALTNARVTEQKEPKLTKIESEPSKDRSLRILVAEDNLINQKVIKRLLCSCNCQVEIANNGNEAVLLASQSSWDLIFMDLLMPVMDGLEATRLIRMKDKITPIVALTANATTDDRDGCFHAGMNDFITKPVSMECLHKIINRTFVSAKV